MSHCKAFCLFALFALFGAFSPAEDKGASDPQAEMAKLRKWLSVNPAHGGAMAALAGACARAGLNKEAIQWLNRALDTGISLDLANDPAFDKLQATPAFKAVLKRAAGGVKPLARASVAFRLAEKDLIPEGIAYDPTEKVFYLGSIRTRRIVRLALDGTVSDFTVSAQDGLLGVLGLRVDAVRRLLWANSYASPNSGGPEGSAGLFKYDLNTGKLIKKYILDIQSGKHLFNDLALTPSGDVFLTDSESGRIYQVRADRDELEIFCDEQAGFIYPNGITLSGDGRSLYIADFKRGITRVDVQTRTLTPVAHPKDVSVFGLDGLYFCRGGLVGIQNSDGLERILHYDLNPAGDRVEHLRVLDRGNPLYRIPMTGAIVDDDLYFVAYGRYAAPNGTLPPPNASPQETVVMRTPLKP